MTPMRAIEAELEWFRRRKVLSDELQSIYAALTESKHEAIVEATAKLFDFDVTKPGAGT